MKGNFATQSSMVLIYFAYRFQEITESRLKCASMEVVHKQHVVCVDQINNENVRNASQ